MSSQPRLREGGFDGLPPLAEKVPVDLSLINGVDAALLQGDGETPFTVSFLGGVGAKKNALGYYIVEDKDGPDTGEDGLIVEAGILFANTEETVPEASVRVGVLEEGQTLGLFLIVDGAALNHGQLPSRPPLGFTDEQGDLATVADHVPRLVFSDARPPYPVEGTVLHASDFVTGDVGNALNPGGVVRTLSGRGEDGSLLVAWEDQPSRTDADFNDVIVRVDGPGLGTGPQPMELADIAAGLGGGFALNGISEFDLSGWSVSSAGDVNGDGLADLIIGAVNADPNGPASGQSYVVFGKADAAPVELAEVAAGRGGFALNSGEGYQRSGVSVGGAGDVNGDGLDDLVIATKYTSPTARSFGQSYVVFGKADGDTVELADVAAGDGGFVINGTNAFDFSSFSGRSVSGAGDVNGDGYADLIIGAPYADPNADSSGQSYVVFGKADGEPIELSEVAAGQGGGFALNGISEFDFSGYSVSGAGDVNGDGLDDLIVGAISAPNQTAKGQSYVVFGKADADTVELADIVAGKGGFAITGVASGPLSGDQAGRSVGGAGDVNGDGLDDLVIGARYASPTARYSGQSYVVFGKTDGDMVELRDVVAGRGGFAMDGIDYDTRSGWSVDGAGDVDGDGLADLIVGAPYSYFAYPSPGYSYVVFGKTDGDTVELHDIAAGRGGVALNGVSERDRSGLSVSGAGDVNGDGLADLIVGAPYADVNGESSGQSYVVFGGDFLLA